MKVLHLYYDLMNLYGESGNIKMIEKYCNDHKVSFELVKKSLNEKLDFADIDLIYIGGGTEKNQKLALAHLIEYKKEIWQYVNNGGKILATGNAVEMFGKYITRKKGPSLMGLSILDFCVKETDKRIIKNVKARTKYGKVVGIVNHTNEMERAEKYGEVILSHKNFYGTYLIGPFLVRNPKFLRNLLCL